jgi:polyisoprenyl-teichoic acid--peptidoglycan teichoic acid transferase
MRDSPVKSPRKDAILTTRKGRTPTSHWAGSILAAFRSRTDAGQTAPVRPTQGRKIPLRYIILAAALVLALLCVVGYASIRSYAPAAAQEVPTLTATPFLPATITPTPFGPSQGVATETTPEIILPETTATPVPLNPPWAPYAGPIHPASIAIPTPVKEFDQGPDVLNVALLGLDTRPYGGSYNTDTMIILSLNKAKKTAVMISFPRDTYVYIPAYGMWRLNAAFGEGQTLNYPGGKFALLQDTYKYNFGLRIDHYIAIDFSGFKDMINSLGGIDVYAASALTDKRDKFGMYTVPAGGFHMDGETALWYVRSRYTSSDLDRNRRQQEVLMGMVQRLLNLNALGNIPGFFVTLTKYVESDLTLDILTPYAEMAAYVSPGSIRRFGLATPDHLTVWWTPEGSNVLLPNTPAILAYLDAALNQ